MSKIVTVPGKNIMNLEEGLLSAGSDGTLALWYPSAKAESVAVSASQEMTPTAMTKVHESDIFALAVVSVASVSQFNPDGLRSPIIVTSGRFYIEYKTLR